MMFLSGYGLDEAPGQRMPKLGYGSQEASNEQFRDSLAVVKLPVLRSRLGSENSPSLSGLAKPFPYLLVFVLFSGMLLGVDEEKM